MPDTKTAWPGIIIRTSLADSKLFDGLVIEALNKIDSKPVGKQLLATITAEIAKEKYGYLVCIKPKKSIKDHLGPLIRWRTYDAGSVTKSASDQNASDGTGTVSGITWDPKNHETPDGSRPPYIGLSHELIHCMYNLLGTSQLISGQDAITLDEMRVTGLRGYEQAPISENRIRREHGVALRVSYVGRCSKQDGSPNKDSFT